MRSPRPSRQHADPVTGTSSNGQVAGRYSHDGYSIVWATGEIDVATAPGLRHELADAVSAHQCRVIVDLTQVPFMDSTGLNVLVLASSAARAHGGELRLVGACGNVRKLLRITGLEQVFPVHSTIEESIG